MPKFKNIIGGKSVKTSSPYEILNWICHLEFEAALFVLFALDDYIQFCFVKSLFWSNVVFSQRHGNTNDILLFQRLTPLKSRSKEW